MEFLTQEMRQSADNLKKKAVFDDFEIRKLEVVALRALPAGVKSETERTRIDDSTINQKAKLLLDSGDLSPSSVKGLLDLVDQTPMGVQGKGHHDVLFNKLSHAIDTYVGKSLFDFKFFDGDEVEARKSMVMKMRNTLPKITVTKESRQKVEAPDIDI